MKLDYVVGIAKLTLIFMSLATFFLISRSKRSPKPLKSVEPPDSTMFW